MQKKSTDSIFVAIAAAINDFGNAIASMVSATVRAQSP